MTIQELRKNHTVYVTHRRLYKNEFGGLTEPLTTKEFQQKKFYCNPPSVKPYEKGGRTEVELVTDDGSKFCGVAFCSISDSFNRKVGLEIALDRCLRARYNMKADVVYRT